MALATFTWSDLGNLALAIFLIVLGLALAYALFRLGETFRRLSSLISGTERELLPVINKTGGTVDRVNAQLDKVDRMTDSAVDAVESVDAAVRTASRAVSTPVRKLSGFAAGVQHGAATLKARRDWRGAAAAGKEAAARRERGLADELRRRDRDES